MTKEYTSVTTYVCYWFSSNVPANNKLNDALLDISNQGPHNDIQITNRLHEQHKNTLWTTDNCFNCLRTRLMLTHFITTQANIWMKTTIIETTLSSELLLLL
jgi:hypothetical protein